MAVPVEPSLIQLNGLTDKGRGQYFYHDSESPLPVRDISGRGKTEPYIEYGHEEGVDQDYVVGAENYCNECYQNYIQNFLESDRRYLFLMTTPQNRSMSRQIVGFLRKDDFIDQGDYLTVIGKVELYRFEDAVPADELGKGDGRSGHKFDAEETEHVLHHFATQEDVTEDCVKETLRLKQEYGDGTTSPDGGCTCGSS